MKVKITPDYIRQVDRDGMWDHLINFPSHWQEAVEFTKKVEWGIRADRIKNICFAGMGGSAIGADLLRAYSLDSCPVPVYVNRDYDIPAWVDDYTLFVACSFSGNTEETLSSLEQAREQGAQIVAVTSGGRLLVESSGEGYGYVKIPGGMPPRAALAYSFVPLFRLFHDLGYIDQPIEVLETTQAHLREQGEVLSDLDENRALEIAREIQDTLPIIYTGGGLTGPVGLRWRCQFEENSKVLAYGNQIPEMNHNEIVGWEQTAHLTGRLSVIILEDESDHPKVKQRMQIVKEMVDDLTVFSTRIPTRGEERLTRQFSLVQLGDWVSFYLALVNGVDPTPIAKIELLKSRLAEL